MYCLRASIIVVFFIHGTLGGGVSLESYNNTTPTKNELIVSLFINGESLNVTVQTFNNTQENISTSYSYTYCPFQLIRAVCMAAPDWYLTGMKYWWQKQQEPVYGTPQRMNMKNEDCKRQVTRTNNYEWPVMFRRLQLDSSENRQRLICDLSHINKIKPLKYQIEVIFNEIDASNEFIFFVVNNLVLFSRPLKPHATKTFQFVYEYYDGEEIKLELKTNQLEYTMYNFCTSIGENTPKNYSITGNSFDILLEKSLDTLKIFCQLQSPSEIINAVIIFISDTFLYEPYLTGISLSKTLKKYKMSRTTTIIHYEISPEEIFKFKCSSEDMKHKLVLHFDSQSWTSSKYHQTKSIGNEAVNKIEAQFQLSPDVTSTLITCKSLRHGFNYTTKLYIFRNNQYKDTNDYRKEMTGEGIPFNVDLGRAFKRRFRESDVEYVNFDELNQEYFEKPDTGCPRELRPTRLSKLQIEPILNETNTRIVHKKFDTANRTTEVNTPTPAKVSGYAEDTDSETDWYIQNRARNPNPVPGYAYGTNEGPKQIIGPVEAISSNPSISIFQFNSSQSFILVIIGIVLFSIIAATAIFWLIRVLSRRKKETDQTAHAYENAVVRVDVTEERASIASSHIYEVIPEPGTNPAAHATTSDVDTEISERPPCSLPEENEDKKYVHYETPYDFRIFRIGMPVVDAPDRFRSRRGRF